MRFFRWGSRRKRDAATIDNLREMTKLQGSIVKNARMARDRAIEKHDAMVASLRELQEQKDKAQRERLETMGAFSTSVTAKDELVQVMQDIIVAEHLIDEANYWVNKSRTDEDHDDALRQVDGAETHYRALLAKAKALLPTRHYNDDHRYRETREPRGYVEGQGPPSDGGVDPG
jgi:hypothetical protein